MDINKIEACTENEQCKRPCARKYIYRKKNWFYEWIKGSPEGDCPFYIEKKQKYTIQNLFEGD